MRRQGRGAVREAGRLWDESDCRRISAHPAKADEMTGPAGHDHAHDHGHGHPHATANFGRDFALGIGLNLVFVDIEAGYGFLANYMEIERAWGREKGYKYVEI